MRFKSVAHAMALPMTLMIFGLAMISISTAHAGEITVYTSLEEPEIADYLVAAKKDMPDIKVNVLRLSTGDLGARILSEGNHPRYDVIWGWALTNMMDPRVQALLQPYQPKGLARVPARFKDPNGKWFAPTGYMAALCVNTDRLKRQGLPMPTGWTDLLNPVYKGELVMPNPASSGTGYLQVVSILQGLGGEKGWDFLKQLNANVAQYSKSGSRPCSMASTGEYAIGASSAIVAMQAVRQGYPVKMVIPREGAGYELEANALAAGSPHQHDAERFLDWTISDDAARLYGKYKEIVGIESASDVSKPTSGDMPSDVKKMLFPMDFNQSMETRPATLARWQKEIEHH
ncbi:MAG TPA: ABC transporter substrate-binding protein [Halothiobacillus sp.]|nr:ABC transporter substrate-binding protein [Halothiobacillus sp.]